MSPTMMTATVVFGNSVIMEFMRGPWGLPLFVGGVLFVMILGFWLMKYLDDSVSFRETYHNQPRG
jgi:hypothetical protein